MGRDRLPRMPWRVAASDPTDTVVVHESHGSLEPARRIQIYGDGAAADRFHKRPRSSTLRTRMFRDVVILPHNVILSAETFEILQVSFGLSTQDELLVPSRHDPRRASYKFEGAIYPARHIDKPLFLADSSHAGFGHTLVETVPMLEMARSVPGVRIASSARIFSAMFDGMGFDPDAVLRINGPVFCKTVYIPDPPLELAGYIHTVARRAFDRLSVIAAQSAIEPKRRIYLSRSKVDARRLINESAIEELFRRYGFTVIHPQDLSLPDQIKLILGAEAVAGPTGSAMHNLVFAAPTTKALFLTSPIWFVDLDRFVAKVDDQFGFVFGTAFPAERTQTERERSWTIGEADVEAAMRKHFGL